MLRIEKSCEWCGGLFLQHPRLLRSYCSARCAREHNLAGYGPSKPVMEERRAKPAGPKGCATIDEWLARGGTITVCPPAMRPDLGGIPARPSRGTLHGDGAVRRAR